MAKWIDAEALKQAIYEQLGSGKCNYGFIARVIDSQIAADVEPVKRGKWIFEREPDGTPYCFHCSNCGAKMDEEG